MAQKSKVGGRFPSADVFFGTSADLPRIVEIDIASIVPNPDQPRKNFDEVKLRELADSIAENGLIHPVTVRKAEGDGYMIIAGERRFRAFALLERTAIPAIISQGGIDELALIENIQRENLSPIDEYEAVAHLIQKHRYSQSDAARVLGKSRVSINELLSLGSLDVSILDEARDGKVSKSALIEIVRAGDENAQRDLWEAMRRGGGRTVQAARKAKTLSRPRQARPSAFRTALRAGRKFASAIATLPENRDLPELRRLTGRLTQLLDQFSIDA